jgi:hypothetical protein
MEFTVWTPLQDCSNEDTPRLLLLNIGEHFDDVFSESDSGGDPFLPIQLRPELVSETINQAAHRLDGLFERLYANKNCYAPKVPFGSAVLFNGNVVHGSYRRSSMTVPRYSLDFRTVGVYRSTLRNAHYQGKAFRTDAVPNGTIAHSQRAIRILTNAIGNREGAREILRRKLRELVGSR